MASTRSWCAGVMTSTWRRAPSRRRAACRPPPASVSGGGVRMHQRFSNSVAKPASGPECSVPATGWAGTKCTPFGRCGARRRSPPLHRAHVGDDAPGFSDGAIAAASGPQAPTGVQRMTRSAPARRPRRRARVRIGEAERLGARAARPRRGRRRRGAATAPPAPRRERRGADQADADEGERCRTAVRQRRQLSHGGAPAREARERLARARSPPRCRRERRQSGSP